MSKRQILKALKCLTLLCFLGAAITCFCAAASKYWGAIAVAFAIAGCCVILVGYLVDALFDYIKGQ